MGRTSAPVGRAASAEVVWAAKRTGLALSIEGPRARSEAVAALLRAAGVAATAAAPRSGPIRLRWAVPAADSGDPAAERL